MTQKTFQHKIILQALTTTSKVKEKLDPFIRQICKGNIEHTFLVFSQLYQYLSLPQTQLNYKFNSLVAIKILMDTCQFAVILIVEVYFLPIIKKIACYQINQPQKSRGIDYFYNNGYEKSNNSKKLGYNFVRLACQIINIFSIVKPYEMFKNQQVSQPSEYAITFEYMRSQGWREYDQLAFYSQNPLKMRTNYFDKLLNFQQHLQKYHNFIRSSLQNILKKDLLPIGLDPRKLLQFYQPYACSFTIQLLKEFTKHYEAVILTNLFRLISQMVRWGNIAALYTIEIQNDFDCFIGMIQKGQYEQGQNGRVRKGLDRIAGSQMQKINLYVEILKSLEIWAACIPKNLTDGQRDSKSTIFFKRLAFEMKVKFPTVSNIKKIRNECFQNLQKYKRLNQLWLKSHLLKNEIILPRNRRTTLELRQLLNSQTAKVRKSVVFNDSALLRQLSKDSFERNNRNSNLEQKQNVLQNIVNSPRSSTTNIQNQKKCPFTQKFYRQKKKKGQVFDSQLQNSFNRFQTSHFKTKTLQLHQKMSQKQKRRCSVTDSYGHGQIKMMETVPSDPGSYGKVSIQISQEETLYSQEIEEGNVHPVIKSMENKIFMKNVLNELRATHASINTSQNESQKETLKRKTSNKSRVSIKVEEQKYSDNMQFFQSTSSKRSEFCIQEQMQAHAINIFPPQHEMRLSKMKKRQSKFLESDNSSSNENSGILKSQFLKKSEFEFEKLQEKVTNLEEQNKTLKNELQKKEKLISKLVINQNDLSSFEKDGTQKKFSWTNYLFGDQDPNFDDSMKKLSEINKKVAGKCDDIIKIDKFKNQITQLDSLGGKKLINNKDLLLRNENIEIGFLFELQKDIGRVTFYITPQKDLTQLKYSLLIVDNIQANEASQTIIGIARNKQKKISFSFKVKPPFLLPKFTLSYSIQGTMYSSNAIIPISFNKFVTFQQRPSTITVQSLLRKKSHIQMINKRLFKTPESFNEYFHCIACFNHSKQEIQMKSSVLINNKLVNILFTILNQDFIQLEYVISSKNRQIVDAVEFLVIALLAIIKK